MQTTANRRDTSVDIFKYICAVLVLFLHTANLGRPYANTVTEGLTVLLHKVVWIVKPVEFFFLASSFYFFKKHKDKQTNLTEQAFLYAKRLALMYGFWSIFYVKNLLYHFVSVSTPKEALIAAVKSIRQLLFWGTSGHMWYVLSMIYSILILAFILSSKKLGKCRVIIAWAFAIATYAISLAGDSYYYLLSDFRIVTKVLDLIRSVFGNMYLFRGPIFLMLGYQIVTSERKTSCAKSFVLWIVFGIANVCELSLIKSLGLGLLYSITVLMPVASYFMWNFVKSLPLKPVPFSGFLAKASTVTYFLHIFVRDILKHFMSSYYLIMLVDLILCLLITYAFEWQKQHRRSTGKH